jgi:hypothetical protein
MSTEVIVKKKRRPRKKKHPLAQASVLKNGNQRKTIPMQVTRGPDGRLTLVGSGGYRSAAPRRSVRGRGAYFSPDYFERLGDHFFGSGGKVIGEGVQSLAKIFGLGKYSVETNSLMAPGALIDMGDEVPKIANDGTGEVCMITREEYIGDLLTPVGSTPTPFNIESFNINPSNPELFPWLSAVAENFEEYEFRGLIFTMKTMASDTSTALSLGTMFGATQYDINDPPFQNKQELLNYQYANSRKVSKSIMLPIECKPSNNVLTHLFVAPGNTVPTGADAKFYNMGVLNLGSLGCPAANTPIAEIWVSYDVALYKPKLTNGGDLQTEILGAFYSSSTWTAAAPLLGFNLNPSPTNNFAGTITLGNTINFPSLMREGNFVITLYLIGTAAVINRPTITLFNCTNGTGFWQTNNLTVPANGTTSNVLFFAFSVNITAPGASVLFNAGGTLPSAPTGGILFITQVNGAL